MSHFKMASPRLHAVRMILAGLVFGSILHAQATLNLGSGSGAPASDVSLNLTLSGSTLPAAVQFNLGFNPSILNYQAASVGPAASTKTVTCSGSNGAQTCVIFGVNTDAMANGVIATLRFRIQSTTATSGAIDISNTIASTPSGATINIGSSDGTISINQPVVNRAPTATNASVTTTEDIAAQPITLAGTDPDGDTLTFSIVTQPTKGTLTGSGAARSYKPNANANGSDSFTFRVSDGKGGADDGLISITVNPVNDPPTTQNQSISTQQNTPKAITLTGSDIDGNTLSYSIVSGVSHGSLTGSGSNRTYTPANGYSGPDSFTFQVNDGNGGTANGTVSITVQASQNGAPTATDSSVTTNEDTPRQITLSGTDPNGDTLSFSVLTQPAKGSLSPVGSNGVNWTYTPKANANGPDSFTFRASDGKGGTDDGAIAISITAVNDPPTTQNQSTSTAQNTQKQIALAGSDVDGDPLTYTIMSAPAHGTLNGTGANRTYIPANGYSGPDNFTYRVSDGKLNADGAVNITVQAGQNKPPTATDVSVSTNQDTKKNITLGGTDPDGDTLAFSITGGPSHGALSGTAPNVVYTPASGYSGSDSFTFKVDDKKGGSDSGVVSINVVGSDSDAPRLTSLNCYGNSIEGAGSRTCDVAIDRRAPSGGIRVNLSNPSKQLSVPDSVRIGSRANSATFKIRSSLIKVEETVQLTASLANGAAAQNGQSTVSTKIQLIPLKPKDVSCSPLQIRAGGSSTCRVTLNSSSFSGGTSLAISANSSDVKVPANIALRSGRSSVSFRLATRDSSKQQSVNVSVGMNGAQVNSAVSILSSKAPLISVNNPRVVWAGKRFSMAVTAVDPNDLPVNLSAKGVPSVADFDARSGRFDWTPTKAQAGTHSVTFTAINSADASSEKVVEIEVIDGALKVLGFTNSASSSAAAPCSPGSLATLWGAGFSEGPLKSAGTFPLPVSLNNIRVTINAIEAKLLYVGASQINLQCPDLPAGESLSIAVEKLDTGDTATWSAPEVLMRAASPAIFSLDGSGAGQGLVLNAETSSLAMLSTPEIEGQAAEPGDTLVIYANGLGAVDRVVAPGEPAAASPLSRLLAPVSVKVGDVSVPVTFAGLAPDMAGVFQINAELPKVVPLGPDVPVTLEVQQPDGTMLQSNVVTISIQEAAPPLEE